MAGKRYKTKFSLVLLSLTILTFSTVVFYSCGNDKPKTKTVDTKPISIKKFDTPPGADPSVPADKGGNGFTGEGWTTNTKLVGYGDPKAVKGGSISWSIPDFPATLRPIGKDENSYYTRMAQNMLYERLLQEDPVTGEFAPLLATHWKISEDKLTFTFRINPNARWADGKPVTTDDYLATWKMMLDPELLTGNDEFYKENFEMPVAESKYIVSVKAKKLGWFYFDVAGGIKILPAHYLQDDKGNMMKGRDFLDKYNYDPIPGSGPYYIRKEDVEKGRSITMRRRSDYWAEKENWAVGLNNFDVFKTDVIQDDNLEFEKFKKGEIDVYQFSRAQWWAEKSDFDDVKRGLVVKKAIYNQKPLGTSGIALNMRKEPFNDIKMREAVNKLIDFDKWNEKLFFKQYKRMKSFFGGTPYEDPTNKEFKYDLDGAIKLLEESGYTEKNAEGYRTKGGKVLQLELPYSNKSQERYLTILQEDFKKAGIKLDLKEVDGTTNFKIGNERNFTMIIANWGGQNPPSLDFNVVSKTADEPNSTNWPGYKSTRVDEIVKQYTVTFNKKERIPMVQEIDRILYNMYPYGYFWNLDFIRIEWQNKFGVPAWILSKGDDYYGGTDTPIFQIWWYDPVKAAAYDEARKDNTKKIPTEEVENKFWMTNGKNETLKLSDFYQK